VAVFWFVCLILKLEEAYCSKSIVFVFLYGFKQSVEWYPKPADGRGDPSRTNRSSAWGRAQVRILEHLRIQTRNMGCLLAWLVTS